VIQDRIESGQEQIKIGVEISVFTNTVSNPYFAHVFAAIDPP
jgi:hypothetical protein